jgi:c-di-GMP-binding flagellar brake protein YcgR
MRGEFMEERRNAGRWNTVQYLKVHDNKTKKLAGRLVDISVEGFKLMGEKPLRPGIAFKLRLSLPEPAADKKSITFEAESRWSQRSINPDLYDTGFRITHISPDGAETIRRLIGNHAFNH